MSRIGLDWYKREPVAYLGDVQGLTAKQHAVYSVVLDLLYVHGGTIQNDPKFISGYITDMGPASVRRALAELNVISRITIEVSDAEITQKRARNEAKSKQKLRESAQKSGEKGGKKSAESRRRQREINDLFQADPSKELQAEKRREEKKERDANASPKKKASRLSPDWTLPKTWGQWAVEQGVSEPTVRLEADKFRDYWIGVSGRNATKADWQATWRNWIRKVIADGRGGYVNGGQPRLGDTKVRADGTEIEFQGPNGWVEVHS